MIGLQLVEGKIGGEGFKPITKEYISGSKSIALTTMIPPGMKVLCIDTGGCPRGWKKSTGVDGYHLRITIDPTEAGTTAAAPSKEHQHDFNTQTTIGGDVNDRANNYQVTTPTVTYPAIKYLLCEKI